MKCQSMQASLICPSPFLTTSSTAHLHQLANMQSRLKYYHSPATCLYFCGATYNNHIRLVEQNVQNVLTHIQRMEVAGDDN